MTATQLPLFAPGWERGPDDGREQRVRPARRQPRTRREIGTRDPHYVVGPVRDVPTGSYL
jgi:hypothetical protein